MTCDANLCSCVVMHAWPREWISSNIIKNERIVIKYKLKA